MTSPHLTDWGQYGLADIWNMVSQDEFDNFSHVRAWKKMQELCQGMADALKRAADDILAHWPPDKSPAAAAFAEKIQTLAATFTDAAAAAGGNGPTLSSVNIGFAVSHNKIAELRDEWARLQRDEQIRVMVARSALAAGGSITFPLTGGIPVVFGIGGSDHDILKASNTGLGRTIVDAAGAPPVPTEWRADLDGQAREVMSGNDRELLQARTQLTPVPVAPAVQSGLDWPPPGSSGGGGGGAGFTGSARPSSGAAIGTRVTVPDDFPAGSPGTSPWGDDPILEGGPLPTTPIVDYPGLPGGGPVPMPSTGPAGGSGPVPWVTTPGGRALAPGAVIGDSAPGPRPGAAGAGYPGGMMPMGAPPGRPGPSKSGAKGGFVAPPGGLIGGRPQGRGGLPSAAASRRRRRDDEDGWTVASGVPGVLTPDPEPDQFDPGPGVIGIDR